MPTRYALLIVSVIQPQCITCASSCVVASPIHPWDVMYQLCMCFFNPVWDLGGYLSSYVNAAGQSQGTSACCCRAKTARTPAFLWHWRFNEKPPSFESLFFRLQPPGVAVLPRVLARPGWDRLPGCIWWSPMRPPIGLPEICGLATSKDGMCQFATFKPWAKTQAHVMSTLYTHSTSSKQLTCL